MIIEHRQSIETLAGLACRSYGFSPTDAEECAAHAMAHLAVHSLPRYDEARGSLKGFIYTAAKSAINDECRRMARVRRYQGHPFTMNSLEYHVNARHDRRHNGDNILGEGDDTTLLDERIVRFAEQVRRNPRDTGLTSRQAKVFLAVINRGDKTLKDLAPELGYEHRSNLSHMLKRIHQRLARLLDEHLEQPERLDDVFSAPCQRDPNKPEQADASASATSDKAPPAAAMVTRTANGASGSSHATRSALNARSADASRSRPSPTTSSRSPLPRSAA